MGRIKQDKCNRGHRLEGDNLYVAPDGRRTCRKCRKIRLQAYRKTPGYRRQVTERQRKYPRVEFRLTAPMVEQLDRIAQRAGLFSASQLMKRTALELLRQDSAA